MRVLVVFMSLILTSQAFAWGSKGHRVVGEVAEKFLDLKAKHNIKKILGDESLAKASNWADEIKSDEKIRIRLAKKWTPIKELNDETALKYLINSWHYTTVSDGKTYDTTPHPATGDIFYGLKKMESILRDKKSSVQDKREALRFLVHFTGDVHQPLHVGGEGDRGGNDCWVNFFPDSRAKNIDVCEAQTGTKPNEACQRSQFVKLHAMWDTFLIDRLKLSAKELANDLVTADEDVMILARPSLAGKVETLSGKKKKREFKKLVKKWKKELDFKAWINESKEIRVKYAYPGDTVEDGVLPPYCFKKGETVKFEQVPKVSWGEVYTRTQIVELRLLQAGVRLAGLLNDIF